MQRAEGLFEAGELEQAREALQAHLREAPGDRRARTFLFELLCFSGELERAEKQIEVLAGDTASTGLGATAFRGVLEAESVRQRLFTDGEPPHTIADPPAWLEFHLQALRELRAGTFDRARAALAEGESLRAPLRLTVDGRATSDLRDGDDLFAPLFEVIYQHRYYWIPLERVRRLETNAPERLRDTYWLPGSIELSEGPLGEVLLPVLYPGSAQHPDPAVRLGRATDWLERGEVILGAGQHTFYMEGGDRGLLEIREITAQAAPEK